MSQGEEIIQLDLEDEVQPAQVETSAELLLQGFRFHYNRLQDIITTAVQSGTDPGRLSRIGDDLDEYINLVKEVNSPKLQIIIVISHYTDYCLCQYEGLFQPEELSIIQENLTVMQSDIRIQYRQALDDSHQGHPTVIRTIHSGRRGQPRIWIDPEFLQWAYSHRSTSGIARFLNVSRQLVRNTLLAYGIAQPQTTPTVVDTVPEALNGLTSPNTPSSIMDDRILEPHIPVTLNLNEAEGEADQLEDNESTGSQHQHQPYHPQVSYSSPMSNLSDEALDELVVSLRLQYQRAGISILDGMIRAMGLRISRERVRQSLLRIDPVRRVFERITIRRRTYSVPGPNSLWHHDGQHGKLSSNLIK